MSSKKSIFRKEFLIMQRAEKAVLAHDYITAIRLCVRLLKSDPNNVDILSKLASIYVVAGEDSNALKIYTTVIQNDPSNISALSNLGGICRRMGQYKESIQYIEKTKQLGVAPNEIAYNKGYTYKLMGKYDKAVNCFLSAIEANPKDVLAYNHLGTIEDLRGNTDKARAFFSRGLQIDPNHPILHYNLALHFSTQNETEKAIKHFEAALRSKPNWDEALLHYSELLMNTNRSSRAEEILLQNTALNQKNINAYNKLGQLYSAQDNFEKAESAYLKVLELDNENMCALSGLGAIYDKQEKYFDAAAIMERLGKLKSSDIKTSLRYAKILIELDRLKDAGVLLQKIYTDNPDNVLTLNIVGQYFARNKNIKKAYSCYRRIFRLAPNEYIFLKDNAKQFMYARKFRNAEQLLKEYLSRRSDDADAWTELSKCYKALGDYKEALKALKCSLNIDSANFAAIEQLGSLNQYLNEDPAAMNLIAELLNKNSIADPDLDTLRSSMAARESAIDIIEKNEKETLPRVLSDANTKDESLFPEDNKDELIKLDISAGDDNGQDEYEPLILVEPEDKQNFEKPKNEHFDFSGLFPEERPIEFALSGKETLFDDFFDKQSSQHFDPVEEEEYLSVDGSGFDPESVEEEKKEKPAVFNPPFAPAQNSPPRQRMPEQQFSNVADPLYPAEPFRSPQKNTSTLVNADSELPIDCAENKTDSPAQEEKLANRSASTVEYESPAPDKESNKIFFDLPDEPEKRHPLESEEDNFDKVLMKQVREVLDKLFNTSPIEDFSHTFEMFNSLRNLCSYLPNKKKEEFFSDLNRVKLDYVIARLKGKPGLLAAAQALQVNGLVQPYKSTKKKKFSKKALSYMDSLIRILPDKGHAQALHNEIYRVINSIKKTPYKER